MSKSMAITITVNGKQLDGCTCIERKHSRPKYTTDVGGQGSVQRMRNHDVGNMVASFDEESDGHTYLQGLSDEHSLTVTVSGDPGGADIESECYLDRDQSDGTDWVFTGITMPR